MRHLYLLLFVMLPILAGAQNFGNSYQNSEEISDGGVLNGTYHNFRQFYIENQSKIKIDHPGVDRRRQKLAKAKEVQKRSPRTQKCRVRNSNNIGNAPKRQGSGYRSRRSEYGNESRGADRDERNARRAAKAEAEAEALHTPQEIMQARVIDAQVKAQNFKPSTTSANMIADMQMEREDDRPLRKVAPTEGLDTLDEIQDTEEEDMDAGRLVARYEAGDPTLSYEQMNVVINYYENDLAAYNDLVEENTNKLDINPKKELK